MTPRKPKPDDDDVQKVTIEDVGPKAKAQHEQAVRTSIMNEKVLIAFFGAIVATTTCIQMYLQYRRDEAQKDRDAAVAVKVDQAAEKAETVKTTLDAATRNTNSQLNELHKTTHETKILVNSGSLATLQLLASVSQQAASLTRLRAEQTGKQQDIDIADRAEKAAILAEKNVKEHEAKQAAVDAAANK